MKANNGIFVIDDFARPASIFRRASC